MAYTKICAFFFLTMAFLWASMADVYNVGDGSFWTNEGTDYKSWASKHKFQVGDIIVFNYNPQIHNVLRVTKEDYKACSSNAPLATYAGGNDQLELNSPGNYYFICGFPGMCQDGQKVEIKVSSKSNPKEATPVGPPLTNNPTPPGCNSSLGTSPHNWFYSASSAPSLYNRLWLVIFASSVLSLHLH